MTVSTYQPVDVESEMSFLRREPKHDYEKAYRLRYDPGEGIPRTNCNTDEVGGLTFHDFRGREKEFSLEKEGFTVARLETKLRPEDFDNEEKVKSVWYPEVQECLMKMFSAKRVEVLEHGIRKRHKAFPISTGGDYDFRQPASVAHIDFTPNAALESSQEVLKIDTAQYDRVQCLNLWKPLYGPLTDWPLALCDARTVNPAKDLADTDVVMRTGVTENYSIYANSEHKWYYLNNQLASEVLLFRQTDTDPQFAIGVPHASFRNPKSNQEERPRESIETRAFLYY